MRGFWWWVLALAGVLAVAVWAFWVPGSGTETVEVAPASGSVVALPEGSPVDNPNAIERSALRRIAPVLGIEYPLNPSEGLSLDRYQSRPGTHWFMNPATRESLVIRFPEKSETQSSVRMHIDGEGRILDLRDTRWGRVGLAVATGDWATCPDAEKTRMDAAIATTTAVLTGTPLSVRSADTVSLVPDDGGVRIVWYRREDGIRFEDDRFYFVFRISDMRLVYFTSFLHSRVVGGRTPRISREKASMTALKKCESLSFPPRVTSTIGSLGYEIEQKSVELRYVNPGAKHAIQISDPRCPTEDEAILAYVVSFDIRPPNAQDRGEKGTVSIWVDAEDGKVVGGETSTSGGS